MKLAVIGAGSFGKNHVRVVRENSRAELRFVVDADVSRARELAGAATATPMALVVGAWLAVGIPLAWGVYVTALKAIALFAA